MKKLFLLIWENPKSHQTIFPIVKKLSKKFRIYLISRLDNKISYLEKKDSNFSHYCYQKEFKYSKNSQILNKFYLLYFLLYSLIKIILYQPKYIYIINKYPLLIVFFIKIFSNSKIIYHNFDYEPKNKNFFHILLNKIEKKVVRYLYLIIFSHEKRAIKFLNDTKIKKKYLIFNNSLSLDYYKKYKKRKNHISFTKKKLFYFGSIGPGHALNNIIKSFKYLENNIYLTIYGWVVDYNYYKNIKKLIIENNLSKNISVKLDVKDYVWKQEILKNHLGIALYEDISLSHKYMFTASQKINAYIAANIPVLVTKNRDNKKFIDKYNCGVCTSLYPKMIAKNINLTLKNKKKYLTIKKNTNKTFKKVFNFENQFKKIENEL